ncbi:hypothetical protein HMPREF3213_02816 [Heyndrickxia coagulans]|uniref:Uncharacterized protein n=1 Tax=Heyndrickxia coagulans TaxID=1398 RepID=A0A133KHK1_HEYCO|nr:hypothetical protein HMPREF3213_02816 [Heyndrickxia coagulans]
MGRGVAFANDIGKSVEASNHEHASTVSQAVNINRHGRHPGFFIRFSKI